MNKIRVNPRESAFKLLLSRARTSTGEVDWEYLFQLAGRHSIVPLVYVQLDLVPPEVLAKFKQHYVENSARNTVLTAELCRLINLFRDAGIETIPYTLIEQAGSACSLASHRKVPRARLPIGFFERDFDET